MNLNGWVCRQAWSGSPQCEAASNYWVEHDHAGIETQFSANFQSLGIWKFYMEIPNVLTLAHSLQNGSRWGKACLLPGCRRLDTNFGPLVACFYTTIFWETPMLSLDTVEQVHMARSTPAQRGRWSASPVAPCFESVNTDLRQSEKTARSPRGQASKGFIEEVAPELNQARETKTHQGVRSLPNCSIWLI